MLNKLNLIMAQLISTTPNPNTGKLYLIFEIIQKGNNVRYNLVDTATTYAAAHKTRKRGQIVLKAKNIASKIVEWKKRRANIGKTLQKLNDRINQAEALKTEAIQLSAFLYSEGRRHEGKVQETAAKSYKDQVRVLKKEYDEFLRKNGVNVNYDYTELLKFVYND